MVVMNKKKPVFAVLAALVALVAFRISGDIRNCTSSAFLDAVLQKHTRTAQNKTDETSGRAITPVNHHRIKYELRRDRSHQVFLYDEYKCSFVHRPLPQAMRLAPGVFDFETEVDTDLNMLVMGDSTANQIAERLQESVGVKMTRAEANQQGISHTFQKIKPTQRDKQSIVRVQTPPGPGGIGSEKGVVAAFRVTNMFLRRLHGPSLGDGQWLQSEVDQMLNFTFPGEPNQKVGSFDTVLFKIPQGWIPYEAVTLDSLNETVHLIHEKFGATTIILSNLAHCAVNHNDRNKLNQMLLANERIRAFVANWRPSSSGGGVQHVLLMDLAQFSLELFVWNARLIGIQDAPDMTTAPTPNLDFLSFQSPRKKKECDWGGDVMCCSEMFNKSRSQPCGYQPPFVRDSIHWCLETIGGRVSAVVACMLACIYNTDATSVSIEDGTACVHQCNKQFMSVLPVNPAEIEILGLTPTERKVTHPY